MITNNDVNTVYRSRNAIEAAGMRLKRVTDASPNWWICDSAARFNRINMNILNMARDYIQQMDKTAGSLNRLRESRIPQAEAERRVKREGLRTASS